MPKHKHRHRSVERDGTARLKKLASAIAKGNQDKARALIAEMSAANGDMPLCSPLEEKASRLITAGESVLHVAARSGQVALIDVLLAHGADINVKDARKRTPLHIAGPAITRALLAAAERHGQHIDMAAVDAAGCTVDDAVYLALRDEDIDEAERAGGAGSDDEQRRRALAMHSDDYEGLGSRRPQTSEKAWQARLREESYFEEREQFGAAGGGGAPFGSWGDDGDDQAAGEDWFSEIAAAYAARQAAKAREAREQAEAAAGARQAERDRWQNERQDRADAAAAERQKQAEAAFERFAEAQKRAELLAGLEAKAEARARYVAAWVTLAPRTASADMLRAAEVPWPSRVPPGPRTPPSADEVALHVLTDDMDAAARRRALTTELRRWHPDKFVSRWGARLHDDERDAVLLHVKQVSQALTELLAVG